MSALWTPGRAGASSGSLRHSPESPSRVRPHRPLLDVCAGSRWSWFDSGPAQNWLELARVGLLHEGRDLLAKGCAYCTKAPPTQSAPRPPPVAPHPRAVQPDDAGNHHRDRGSPSDRPKQQLSHLSPIWQTHPTSVSDVMTSETLRSHETTQRGRGYDRAPYGTNTQCSVLVS